MRIKKSAGKLIKGWLPREQQLPTQALHQSTLKTEFGPLITGLGGGLVALGVGFCFFSSYHIDDNLPVEVILNAISHYLVGIAVGCAFLVLGVVLVILGIKKQSQNRLSIRVQSRKNFIKGWFPKEPTLSTHRTTIDFKGRFP